MIKLGLFVFISLSTLAQAQVLKKKVRASCNISCEYISLSGGNNGGYAFAVVTDVTYGECSTSLGNAYKDVLANFCSEHEHGKYRLSCHAQWGALNYIQYNDELITCKDLTQSANFFSIP